MSEHGPVIGETLADSTPWWPEEPERRPNVLIVLMDDVGFSDFGCYGGDARTPTIDAIAARGVRFTGFHTTAMCSTTRAALLTGRNHHSVGVGCLANFDSGYPGYRGKIAKTAGTLPEMLRTAGYRNYMVGKWHVTPLHETGPTGPTDGWPLARGFDRFYGFLDAETDHYSPETVRDNTLVPPPGTFEDGYHLTSDLVDNAISMLADHHAGDPDRPWFCYVALGACHAPHQAPLDLVQSYDELFQDGWDAARERRLARQLDAGIVPEGTSLPPRNDRVQAWDDHDVDFRPVATPRRGPSRRRGRPAPPCCCSRQSGGRDSGESARIRSWRFHRPPTSSTNGTMSPGSDNGPAGRRRVGRPCRRPRPSATCGRRCSRRR